MSDLSSQEPPQEHLFSLLLSKCVICTKIIDPNANFDIPVVLTFGVCSRGGVELDTQSWQITVMFM